MIRSDRGYAMAALLVGMAVMAIMLSVALPVWQTAVKREREAELIFRGEQYARAIEIFQRRNGGFPQSLDVLEKTRAIRKLYKDPMTGEDFQPVFVGQTIGGAPVVPGQPGRGAGGGSAPTTRGALQELTGRAGQPQRGRGAAASPFTGGGIAQGGVGVGRGGIAAAGPIIGVVSRSTGDSLRLYNGRGKYNEWAFVAVAMTQQAGAPGGAQQPGVPGRGGPPVPGRGGRQGIGPGGGPGRGPGRGLPPPAFPGRGVQPGGRPGFPGRGVQPGIQFPGPGTTTNPPR